MKYKCVDQICVKMDFVLLNWRISLENLEIVHRISTSFVDTSIPKSAYILNEAINLTRKWLENLQNIRHSSWHFVNFWTCALRNSSSKYFKYMRKPHFPFVKCIIIIVCMRSSIVSTTSVLSIFQHSSVE